MTVKDSFESVTEQVSLEGGFERGKHMELIISDICLICMHVYIIIHAYAALRLLIPVC